MPTSELEQIGPRLRAARTARGWTLDTLARRAGVSSSTLSRLESGKRQASLELLLPLVRQLGIHLDDLLPEEVPDPRVHRPDLRRDGLLITPLAGESAPVQTFRIAYPPTSTEPAPRVHDGYEWLYVLSGRLRLALGDRVVVLGRGEAAEFDTRIPHAMSAAAGRSAEVLSIFTDGGPRVPGHLSAPDSGT